MLGFAIAGEDGRFFPSEVAHGTDGVDNRNRPKTKRNMLVLSSPHVAEPKHYRYAWARNPMANLVNRFGIPIATQRSDDWVLEEMPLKIEAPEGMDERSVGRWLGNQQKKALGEADTLRHFAEAEATVSELKPVVEKLREDASGE